MENYLLFEVKTTNHATLRIHPDVDFREILRAVTALEFVPPPENQDSVKHAVLELISNSIRAHRDKGIRSSVTVTFRTDHGRLEVAIKDLGLGFDPAALPYDLGEDYQSVDPTSERFKLYQQRHNYARFGMGLLLARRVFQHFELSFFDARGRTVPWRQGDVQGTLIHLATKDSNDAN